jgi:phage-related baseplate assembly protein
VDEPDFETLLTERKAEFVALYPAEEQEAVARTLTFESEPVVKILQENVYRELLLRQRINEAAQAVMVAYAGSGDLDHFAQTITSAPGVTPADDTKPACCRRNGIRRGLSPAHPAAFEGMSVAGPTGRMNFTP